MKKTIALFLFLTSAIGFQCSNPVEPLIENDSFKGLTQQERSQIKVSMAKMGSIWQDQFHLRKNKELIGKTTTDDLLAQYQNSISSTEKVAFDAFYQQPEIRDFITKSTEIAAKISQDILTDVQIPRIGMNHR